MNQSPNEIIKLFYNKLSAERMYGTNKFEGEIITHYLKILEILSKDYPTYRRYIPKILSSLEQNDTKSISYSVFIFFQLYDELLSSKTIIKIDLSVLDEKITDQTLQKYFQALDKSLEANNKPRISEFNFKAENLSEQEVKEIVSLLVNLLQDSSKTLEWSADQGDVLMMQLSVLRYLLNSLGNSGLFYFAAGMFLDRLNTSEYFQAARDVSEEIIISSFNDGTPEYGFFNSYSCYSSQGSIHAAILYANISLYCAIHKDKPILDKYLQEIIWQSIKFFRNTRLFSWAINIYKGIPKKLHFSDYERRAIDHTYFTCLLGSMDKNLPNEILDYLHREGENIFRAGIHESTHWLIILYNIKRLYSKADFSPTALGFYLNVFENIVPEGTVEKHKNIISGDSEKLKVYLKKSLIKLNETRNQSDIVYDNEMALKISNRLIEDSFSKQDVEAVLLAMMLKSDFSLIFQPKEAEEFVAFKLPNDDLEELNVLYSDLKQFLKNLSPDESELFIWFAVTEGKVFQLSLLNEKFHFYHLKNWNWSSFDKLSKSDYFSSMSFDNTIKDKNGVREVLPEEHLWQANEISKTLDFSCLTSVQDANSILIIKDMELARFPHNLLLDDNGSFIHLEKPMANILSTEWYLSNKNDSTINNDFTKSIWIPTEDGDFTLNQLYGSLEQHLKNYQFDIFQNTNLSSPISSDLNIVCSHGSKNIASVQVIYPNDKPLVNLDQIVGKGNVLIFFVCHSGSYKKEFFRNNIISMVKSYISSGYKAVIAPFWSLHVNIPNKWLPEFIDSLNKGLSINLAVYNANKAVADKYPTPTAWACMHLYGNPHLSI